MYTQDLGLEGEEREGDGDEDEDDDDGQDGQQEDEDGGVRMDEGGEEEDESCEGKQKPEMKATRSKKPFYYMVLASMSSKSEVIGECKVVNCLYSGQQIANLTFADIP